ncbi:hypothetical protein ACW95P_01705 [Candidatus Mycoplasma pogonae]
MTEIDIKIICNVFELEANIALVKRMLPTPAKTQTIKVAKILFKKINLIMFL